MHVLRHEHRLWEEYIAAAKRPEGQAVLRVPGGRNRRGVRVVCGDKRVQHAGRLPGLAAGTSAASTTTAGAETMEVCGDTSPVQHVCTVLQIISEQHQRLCELRRIGVPP